MKLDIAGFIANRLQAAIMREACYLVGQGIVDERQLDSVVKDGIGMRWAVSGPFEIADMGGLDVWAKVTGNLFPQLGSSTSTPESIEARVRQGELGLKSGKGFYDYGDNELRENHINARDQKLLQLLKQKNIN